MAAKDLGPLDWRTAIVDSSGRPSPEFQRRWNTQRNNNALIGTISFGTGAPTGSPDDGAEYADISTTPYTLYIGHSGAWHLAGTASANPTAIASDTAVNGTATTFMKSDAAPAIQKASSSQFGIVKVDGTTVTATGGVISSTGGGGSGSFVLVNSQTVSGAASVIFDSTMITSVFDDYILEFQNVSQSATGALQFQISQNGGSTWITSGYQTTHTIYGVSTNFSAYTEAASATGGELTAGGGLSGSVYNTNGSLRLSDPLNAATKKAWYGDHILHAGDGNTYRAIIGATYTTTGAYNAIRIIPASGTISGTFRLYGISNTGGSIILPGINHDVTASRVMGTTYTNTTGKPMLLFISPGIQNVFQIATLTIGGITAALVQAPVTISGANRYFFSGAVPPGQTYSVTSTDTVKTIWSWIEYY